MNGKKIGVQEGTTGDLLCTPGEDNEVITDSKTDVQRFKKGTDAVVALNNGGVDAVVIDQNPAENFVSKNPDTLKLMQDDTSTEQYAIAVQKGDTETLNKINDGLKKIKEHGTFDKLVAQYIGGSNTQETANNTGKTLTVGTNAEFPPFEYIGNDGEPEGFDMAVIKAIGKAEGFNVKITNMEFKSLVASLATGSLDAVIAGMTDTPDRRQSVDFSDSYYTATQCIVVKKDSTITKLADLNGKKIGVQLGTSGDTLVSDYEEDGSGTVVERYNKGNDAILALKQGKIDAVVIDVQPAQSFVKTNSEI